LESVPSKTTTKDVSITEKKLTWSYKDENIEGFKLDRKKGDENWQVDFKSFGKEIRNWNDTEIIPDPSLTYSYRIYAYAGPYNSAQKSSSSQVQIPAPSNLQIEKLSDKSYKLTWTDNTNGEEGFKIDRKIADENWQTAYGTVNENQFTFVDTNVFSKSNLAINVEYRVYSFYQSYESTKITANTNAAITAPTYLQIAQNSITSITLNWQDNSTGEDGFKIERKYEGGNWEQFGLTADSTYEDNTFDLNTHVYYRVFAYAGEYSSSIIENDFDATIPAPSDLAITSNSITSVTLTWQDNSTGGDGFKIERKYEGGNWDQLATVTGNSYEDNDFELNIQVYYRISAYFETFNSDYEENNFDAAICRLDGAGI